MVAPTQHHRSHPPRYPSRRLVVGAATATAFGSLLPHIVHSSPSNPASRAMPQPVRFAYVGCRTTRERQARGDGIVVYAVDGTSGTWRQVQLVEKLLNPSFLAFDRTGRTLYTVHGDASEISSFRVDPTSGTLSPLNRVSTKGKNPVHLAVDPANRFVVVVNHVTAGEHVSNLAVIALEQDGSLGRMTDHVPITGKIGPHRAEQPFPKPHQCLFDPSGRFIAVPDKGLDLVLTFRLGETGKLHRVGEAPSREGEGPRHLVFHPTRPYCFVLNELSSTVMSCRFDPASGTLTPIQEISALPDTFIGFSRASEIDISPDGRFVYASNRGDDSIAAFAVDQGTGRLTAAAWTPSAGKTPRFFALDPAGRHLFVANEDSDTIVRFARDEASGAIADAMTVARTGSPTCIVFA